MELDGPAAAGAAARLGSRARRSVSRTDQPPSRASRARRRRSSWSLHSSSARPWPSVSAPRLDQLEHLVGQLEQADEVRDRDAALADPAADLLLREPEVVDERRARARLLDRVEVLARHVLDQRQLEPLAVLGVAHDRGDRARGSASCAARSRRSPAISS